MKDIETSFKKNKHMEKIKYLESCGFEFYENEFKPTKPFGWKKDKIKISYNKLIKHDMDSLRLLVNL